MNFGIEWAKMKRSGFVPAFLAGGALGAFVPVIQMAVRSENDTGFWENLWRFCWKQTGV